VGATPDPRLKLRPASSADVDVALADLELPESLVESWSLGMQTYPPFPPCTGSVISSGAHEGSHAHKDVSALTRSKVLEIPLIAPHAALASFMSRRSRNERAKRRLTKRG
jgi:hypothetical protein